jgi:hypothetical protein
MSCTKGRDHGGGIIDLGIGRNGTQGARKFRVLHTALVTFEQPRF